ncbi:MAG: aldose epimerase family protein [Planctomycetota bacterium]
MVKSFPFGKAATGDAVTAFQLDSACSVRVRLMDRGATLVAFEGPDRGGDLGDVVLGFDSVEGYESDGAYFGCTVGRYANRIAGGRFTLDGQTHTLPKNNAGNTLHGGAEGFDRRLWRAAPFEQAGPAGPERGVEFSLTSPDGDQGFPGRLEVVVRYTLDDAGALRIEYRATTDKPTHVNLTNHAYFNLTGAGSGSVSDHLLTLYANEYTPTDATLIPTGEAATVAGTPLDFRRAATLGSRLGELQATPAAGYDHNFILAKNRPGELSVAAELACPASGRRLTVRTTQPGLQLYTGNHLGGQRGKGGLPYDSRGGCCLETQHFPDSPNQAQFPSTILRPGDVYREVCEYSLAVG